MINLFKSTLVLSACSLVLSDPALANSAMPSLETTESKPEAVKISIESFEKTQAELGLKQNSVRDIRSRPARNLEFQTYTENSIFVMQPRYVLTDQSVAFIGSTRLDNKDFAAYQRSAMTPEGRVTEPLESLASVGVRSKF